MQLYLMRHGETDLNRSGKLQGWTDTPLNEKGRAQARRAGNVITDNGLAFDRIICSPLDRAKETAELATGISRTEFEIDERILEIDYGPYDGRKILGLDWKVLSFLIASHKKDAPKGIESVDMLYYRVRSFLEETRKRKDISSALVVTHGIAMRSMIGFVKGQGSRELWKDRLVIRNCDIFHVTATETGFEDPELIR